MASEDDWFSPHFQQFSAFALIFLCNVGVFAWLLLMDFVVTPAILKVANNLMIEIGSLGSNKCASSSTSISSPDWQYDLRMCRCILEKG